jgi:hypothetical protein
LARRAKFHVIREEPIVDGVGTPLDDDAVGLSMNRDITPSSPHPPIRVVDTARTAAKDTRITLFADLHR